jgi:hypothetical protein
LQHPTRDWKWFSDNNCASFKVLFELVWESVIDESEVSNSYRVTDHPRRTHWLFHPHSAAACFDTSNILVPWHQLIEHSDDAHYLQGGGIVWWWFCVVEGKILGGLSNDFLLLLSVCHHPDCHRQAIEQHTIGTTSGYTTGEDSTIASHLHKQKTGTHWH